MLLWHFSASNQIEPPIVVNDKNITTEPFRSNSDLIESNISTIQGTSSTDSNSNESEIVESNEQETQQEQEISYFPEHVREDGVNLYLPDQPVVQLGYMERGRNIMKEVFQKENVIDVKDTYFHRGDKNHPMTCGSVKLKKADGTSAGYQRYIFAGAKSIYLESEIDNFDILWNKLCVSSYEN